MSANLLDGLRPNVREGAASSDGTLHFPARASDAAGQDWLSYDLQGQSALKENQTYHVGLSVRGASASDHHLRPFVGYMDAAGHKNWVLTPFLSVGTSWGRANGTLVVPSGTTPFIFGVQVIGSCPETWMAAPTLSLGSPVPLASSAHTPYATQDHVAAEYATKAALKVTSDAVTAEVTERGKLAGRVGTLESTSGTHTSKLEQLAASIKSLVKGESTYTDPDGKSATSGIYSLVTQTRDSVTALFGSYTKTADLASTQAVRDARKAGTAAQASIDGMRLGGRNLLKGTSMDSKAVTTPTTASTTWGSGFAFPADAALHAVIPYGAEYRCSVDVLLPVDGRFVVDMNTYAESGTSWTGNDNDNTNKRTSNNFNVKANVWTRLSWGSENTSDANTGKQAIYINDSVGLLPQSAAVTWHYRGLKVELGNKATDWTPAPEDTDSAVADARKAGTDAQAAASAAQTTADSASSTAGAAKSTADSLATMIREDATGITVGKSADGKTYSTGRTRMTDSAFEVLDKAGKVLSSFGKDKVRLGVDGAQIDMAGGRLLIDAQDHAASEMPSGLPTTITRMICPSSNSGKNDTEMYLGAYDKDSGNVVGGMGITVTRETSGSYNTSVGISGSLSAGSATLVTPLPVSSGGTGATSIDAARRNLHISQGSKVCHGHGTPWVTLFDTWADFQAATGCYDSGLPTLVTMNGDMGAFDGTLSGCEIKAGDAVYVLAETTSGLPNLSSSQSLRINWICIW